MMQTFTDAEERLAESLPNYESRPQQQALAAAIEDAIADKSHLLGEAGTGVGKSLAYLIPAVLSGRQTVISTATRALQDQIGHKDIPFLQEHLGKPFTAEVLKGRSNYLCVQKAESVDPADMPTLPQLLKFLSEPHPYFSGERDDLPFTMTDREWMMVASDSDDCSAMDCRNNPNFCFGEMARKRAKQADVVVVNHALYLTDLVVRVATWGNADLIGEHDVVIFDEAHEVEEYAGNVLGFTISEGTFRGLAAQVRNFSRRNMDGEVETDDLIAAMASLWDTFIPGRIRLEHINEHADEWVNLANALIDLSEKFGAETSSAWGEKVKNQFERLDRRIETLSGKIISAVQDSFTETVRWVEEDTKRDRLVLKASPIDVSSYLRDNLFESGVTAILTSATLSVDGKAEYIAGRLGIDEYDFLDVGTPFEYEKQSLLYVPQSLPDPAAERAAWANMAVTEILELVKASEGRALILFTSYKDMRDTYQLLHKRLPYNCMMQGQAPNRQLVEDFKSDTSSVLFATRSFMTGVDIQGPSLSLVIVNKLTFPVPTEPLIEARCEAIRDRGGSDFRDFVMPLMTLTLKQAVGRLIRSKTDEGVVAILDPRLRTKGFGKQVMRSLPPMPVVDTMAEVEGRFGALGMVSA